MNQQYPHQHQHQQQYQQPQYYQRPQWACPFCGYTGGMVQKKKISTAGWIFFVITLFLCIPICWLAYFMDETYNVCGGCGSKFG